MLSGYESKQTSDWSLIVREFGESLRDGKQMTGKTGAPSDLTEAWDSIDWNHVEKQVKRLQMRIAKAAKEDKFGKVKSLQWVLTHSYYAKLLAVKRVTENKGGEDLWNRWYLMV
jgi:RNA-directed DNA polymerase